MRKNLFIVFIFTLLQSGVLFGQVWPKTFSGGGCSAGIYQLKEHYDGGYFLGASLACGTNILRTGWIIKTDVNGNTLWSKKLGTGLRMWGVRGIDTTPDGGVIVSGTCDTLDEANWDPFVMKFSPCGETEWCRIFHVADNYEYGSKILSLPDGGCVVVFMHWQSQSANSIWLLRLDIEGQTLWDQRYFQNDTLVDPFDTYSLIMDDNNFLITGSCYSPVFGEVSLSWMWPMMIMTDTTGNPSFEIPWGYTLPFGDHIGGEGYQSIKTPTAIYTGIARYINGQSTPAIIKTSITGLPISYHDMNPSVDFGGIMTMTKINDNSFLCGTGFLHQSAIDSAVVLKVDSSFNITSTKFLFESDYYPRDAIITHDSNYLITVPKLLNNRLIFNIWKMNLDLEFCPVDSTPRVYDSLCPGQISTSVIHFPCNVSVGVEELNEPAKTHIKVFPNPTHDVLHIVLPERIQKTIGNGTLSVTTTFHKWYGNFEIQIYDLYGQLIKSISSPPSEKEVLANISGWKSGIYLIKLKHKNSFVGSCKFVVE